MVKQFILKKKIRHSKWQFVELGDWAKKNGIPSITPWLDPLRKYTTGKTREEIEHIPSWIIDCNGTHIYDVANNHIVTTDSTEIIEHNWRDGSELRKKLFVVL